MLPINTLVPEVMNSREPINAVININLAIVLPVMNGKTVSVKQKALLSASVPVMARNEKSAIFLTVTVLVQMIKSAEKIQLVWSFI